MRPMSIQCRASPTVVTGGTAASGAATIPTGVTATHARMLSARGDPSSDTHVIAVSGEFPGKFEIGPGQPNSLIVLWVAWHVERLVEPRDGLLHRADAHASLVRDRLSA